MNKDLKSNKENLCDKCVERCNFPVYSPYPYDIVYGNDDNVLDCVNFLKDDRDE